MTSTSMNTRQTASRVRLISDDDSISSLFPLKCFSLLLVLLVSVMLSSEGISLGKALLISFAFGFELSLVVRILTALYIARGFNMQQPMSLPGFQYSIFVSGTGVKGISLQITSTTTAADILQMLRRRHLIPKMHRAEHFLVSPSHIRPLVPTDKLIDCDIGSLSQLHLRLRIQAGAPLSTRAVSQTPIKEHKGITCNQCPRILRNKSGWSQHIRHAHPKNNGSLHRSGSPMNVDVDTQDHNDFPLSHSTEPSNHAEGDSRWDAKIIRHPILNGVPCDINGKTLPLGTPPPAPDQDKGGCLNEWSPYRDRLQFETAEFLYKSELSQASLKGLFDLWNTSLRPYGDTAPFESSSDLLDTIDATNDGSIPWQSFGLSYKGGNEVTNSGGVISNPGWKTDTYNCHFRDPEELVKGILANRSLEGSFDVVAYQEFDSPGKRRYKDFFSANWVWDQSEILSANSQNEGATLVPIILGSDKTTVSVATGANEYYPLYMSVGNIHNSARRAHKDGLVLVAFLPIVKGPREWAKDKDFLLFQRQIFHGCLERILASLCSGMETPKVLCYPDGHFRRSIFSIGPYIADYPEQVLVTGIVSGWCPRCYNPFDQLETGDELPRTKHHVELVQDILSSKQLWSSYGIVPGLKVFLVPYSEICRADVFSSALH